MSALNRGGRKLQMSGAGGGDGGVSGLGLSELKKGFMPGHLSPMTFQSAFDTLQTELCCITLHRSKMFLHVT